jgi:hypothetical protein
MILDFEAICTMAQAQSNKARVAVYVYKLNGANRYYVQNPKRDNLPMNWGVFNKDYVCVHVAYPNG